MTLRIPIAPDILAAYCRRHHIRRLSLFGSVLKESAGPDSDIDLLVEFAPGHEPGYIGLAAMQLELSDLMGGRPVDLRTPAELSRYFRDDILANALDVLNPSVIPNVVRNPSGPVATAEGFLLADSSE